MILLTAGSLLAPAAAASAAGSPSGTEQASNTALAAVADPVDRGPRRSGSAQPIKDRYIVTFASSTSSDEVASARAGARGRGGQIRHEYRRALKGFAASLPAAALDALRKDPRVLSVEPDFEVTASAVQVPTPSWGLDRIDQIGPPLNLTYGYNATGAGVTAYVVDSGIRSTHTDFGGRVAGGFTAIDDGVGTGDCNGHGTHVAGTIGGAAYGVAKDVKIVPVRVLGCDGSGTTSGVIAGVDWITANHASPAVVNMSLGGPASTALDTAVANAIASGVTVVGAAGNSNVDACTSSPARVPAAITVGATTNTDTRAEYSNFGNCLDLFAPGSNITSTSNASDIGTKIMSGTSMATPHVAGVIAMYLQSLPDALPAAVRSAVLAVAGTNVVAGAGAGSPNALLYSALAVTGQPAPTAPPANEAPVAVAPMIILPVAGRQIGTSTVPVQISWSAWDRDGDGLTRYELQQSKDAGTTWTTVPLPAPTATAITVDLPSTASLRYRVRATDGRGLTGGYTTGPTTKLTLAQQTAAAYASSSAWPTRTITGAYGDTVRRSQTAGSTSTFTFNGTQIAWLATTAANRGKAEIFLDGISQGLVDLYSATTKVRQVLFSRAVGTGSHTLRIKVLGARNSAASAAYVDVDGFVTAA